MKIVPNSMSAVLGSSCHEVDVELECELCAADPIEQKGFDTPTWRQKVLPTMICPSCGMSTHEYNEIKGSER